jgi:serine/threonine protein kinase
MAWHREIKPSNVLVTLRDGVPVPKVIDFGIAKATTDQRLTDKTLFTAFDQFVGTPVYMSPSLKPCPPAFSPRNGFLRSPIRPQGLGCAGSADVNVTGNGFDLALQRLNLLLERNHLPQWRQTNRCSHIEKFDAGAFFINWNSLLTEAMVAT